MNYDFAAIEKKWQANWEKTKPYAAITGDKRPKFYGLIEFPYPSGQGLHVGHPRPFTAMDIVTRKKRMQGYNVLFPIGFDAFGLPTENYAIKNHIHPAIVTKNNIENFTKQLKMLGYGFDWDRCVDTTDPKYYKWTQWIFLQMFKHGLAYKSTMPVNWCTSCKCVLANEEVVNGVCERCGSEVIRKEKSQWMLKITQYAQRLIDDLDDVDYIERVKIQQRNWIGRSTGAEITFDTNVGDQVTVYTTRADTLFGTTYMVISPEHPLLKKWQPLIKNWDAVAAYQEEAAHKSDFERGELNKEKTGVRLEGIEVMNPVTHKPLPMFVSDYVLMGYGTGIVMGVPGHDQRDWEFAKKFGLPIIEVVAGGDVTKEAFVAKDDSAVMVNSGFLNGMTVKEAIPAMKKYVVEQGFGKEKVNYKLRDWVFSRQRYWGEPFPIYYRGDVACPLAEDKLPLELPPIADFGPTEQGEPPLARATNWATPEGYPYELSTMPGFAGSSAYYLRYMDPHNDEALVGREADEYWRNVDLYVGGIEHATGHLMYSRFWNMFLYDLGVVCEEEPFRKLVNQGMIQGRSNFVYRIVGTNKFVSLGLKDQYQTQALYVDVNIVRNDILDLDAFRAWMPEYKDAEFILEDGRYVCGWAIEKMSKSFYNVVNPDYIVDNYGADTLRMYEMFLGPLEQSKPWDTNGIDGVYKFLRRFWRLFYDRDGKLVLTDEKATEKELRTLHKTIKKVSEDIENFSFNTSVAAFMICLNELGECNKREVLEPLTVLLAPFAPHIAEELWEALGHTTSVCTASYPAYDEKHLAQSAFEYPVSVNGKLRFKKEYATSMTPAQIQADVVTQPEAQKWLEGKAPKKVIVVPGKIINIVI